MQNRPYVNICGARTRRGAHCKNRPMPNGRCRLHGGKSTGPAPEKMKKNKNAQKHGFFAKIFPNDKETQSIVAEIQLKSPIEILWEQIVIQYTAIARAQKIMWVTDKEEMIKELKRSYEKNTDRSTSKTNSNSQECEYEYEFQFAWDRHATFLQAQSRAINTLERLISRYESLLLKDLDTEEQKLRIETMKAQLEKLKNPSPEVDLTGYIKALGATAAEAWSDEGEADENEGTSCSI